MYSYIFSKEWHPCSFILISLCRCISHYLLKRPGVDRLLCNILSIMTLYVFIDLDKQCVWVLYCEDTLIHLFKQRTFTDKFKMISNVM